MNCEYVDQLLPLYIGRDLEAERSALVAAHLQSCPQCARAAGEYEGVNGLLQEFEPPLFSDAIYRGIRRQVLNEIERTSQAPAWSSMLSRLFGPLVQPRAIAITAAVLLATLIAASYFVIQRSQPSREQVAEGRRAVELNANSSNAGVQSNPQPSSSPSDRSSEKASSRPGVVGSKRLPRRETSVVAVAQRRELRSRTPVARVETSANVFQTPSAPAPLRVEMQTSDPKIRIIWLSDRSQTGAKDASKG